MSDDSTGNNDDYDDDDVGRYPLTIDADLRYHKGISWNNKAIVQVIRTLAKSGEVYISDKGLALSTGLGVRTVGTLLPILIEAGWFTKDWSYNPRGRSNQRRGHRILIPTPADECPKYMPDTETDYLNRQTTNANRLLISADPTTDFSRPDYLNRQTTLLISADPSERGVELGEKRGRKTESARVDQSSFSFPEKTGTVAEKELAVTGTPPGTVSAHGLAAIRNCLTEIVSLMRPRIWDKRVLGSDPPVYKPVQLKCPVVGNVTQSDAVKILALSVSAYPGVDPYLGAVHILRACASTEDDLHKLQNTTATSGALRIGGICRIGGTADPLAFLQERIPPTPPVSESTGVPDPAVVAALRECVGDVWTDPVWDSAWDSAAIACAASGCGPATFMGYALELAGDAPVLWVTSSVTMDYAVERVAEEEATSRAVTLGLNREWEKNGEAVMRMASSELSAFDTLIRCVSDGADFPAWFYVLAPTAFDEKVFNMWGDDARVAFTRSTELRAFAREVVPDRFSALEAKWSRFYDSPVSVPVYPTPCSATRVITGVDVTDDGDAPVAEDTTDFASALELELVKEWDTEDGVIATLTLDDPPKPVTVSPATPATPG